MRGSKLGLTLVEVLISSTLLLLLTGLSWRAVQESTRYYQRSETQLQLERDAMTTLSFVSRELSETNLDESREYSQGIVYPLARDISGKITRGSSGLLLWSSLACIRSETVAGETSLVREQSLIPQTQFVPKLSALQPPRTPSQFATAGLPSRKLQGNLKGVVFRRKDVSQPPDGKNDLIEIEMSLEAKVENREFGIVLESRIYPRN